MKIRFETCVRKTALLYLQKLYPSKTITEELAKDILDLVEADIIRVPDPSMHGKRVAIYPSKNWDNSQGEKYMNVLHSFLEKVKT